MGDKSPEDVEVIKGSNEGDMKDVESTWMSALGMDDGDGEDDDYKDDEDEDAMLTESEDEEVDGSDDDVFDVGGGNQGSEDDVALSETINDYARKERTLIERRQNGYYRDKHKHKKAYEQIVEVYAPYISRQNLLMLHHPWIT